ncbi:MAG: beta-ketoacyl-[acyl-carrier-protein] synthase family protein [Gammaproteobacteria bacterium]|nr:beta-ketoacyl-[acyl-carrier-protein] synthase family protein [Gammaproteobacteria bacterium]
MAQRHDVAITGLGVVSAVGIGVDRFWTGLLDGEPVLRQPEWADGQRFRVGHAAISQPTDDMAGGGSERHECAKRGIRAAWQAVFDARLEGLPPSAELFVGTTSGGEIDRVGAAIDGSMALPADALAYAEAHSAAAAIASEFFLDQPAHVVSSACTSSGIAIAFAYEKIRSGALDIALVGGCDVLRPADFGGFNAIRAVAPDTCRPFDVARKGVLMADGAAFLLLESSASARRRGCRIYAELVGAGYSADASHVTAPDPSGIERAMAMAIADAKIDVGAIEYVNCHGTGTPLNDVAEIDALDRTFGKHLSGVHVTSTKSVTGHLLGTAGAIEALITTLVIARQQIPPMKTVNKLEPRAHFQTVLDKPVARNVRVALSNSLGFGGTNVSLLFARPAEAALPQSFLDY